MSQLEETIQPVHLLDSQDIASTDTVSSILDLAGFCGAMILVNVGTITGVGGSAYLTPTLQESDTTTGTDFDDVADADWSGTFAKIDAAAEDQTTQYASYHGSKRYIRVNLDITGSPSATLVSVVGIVGKPDFEPAVAPSPITAA